jgi:hypothetical protein
MIVKWSGSTVHYQPLFPKEHPTFRNLIHGYLNRAHQDWSKLGIDLLLGAKLDRRATNEEAMFLPENLMKAMDTATVNGVPLVKEEYTLLAMPFVASESYLITPFLLFMLLLVTIGSLSFLKQGWAAKVVAVFDVLLFFVLGCTGLLLLFMWFGTDHALCANNYNLFWALPTHLVAAFFLVKGVAGTRWYFRIIFIVTMLLLLSWAFLPQQLNIALLPLILLIALRSFLLSRKKNANQGAPL